MIDKVKEFEKNGGILQPIRAIVTPTKNKTILDVVKLCNKIAVTHSSIMHGCTKAKDDWRYLVNRSNVIGYFAAIKEGDTVIISYSICKPEDWRNFGKHISKKIAVSKINNKCWSIDKSGCVIEKSDLAPTHGLQNRPWIAAKGAASYMLGTFDQQLKYFVKRVIKYYKING